MNVDAIGYGNPTIENLRGINTETYLDALFADLTQFTFPKNSSEATKEELNQLVKNLSMPIDEETRSTYSAYDIYLDEYYANYLAKYKIPKEESLKWLESIHDDVKPLILKLKYFFQRPRPFQLAYYYKLKLMPYTTLGADSPSFPSGHAIYSKVYSEVLGNHYPELYDALNNIHEQVCESRLMLGVHYQSDIDVGIYVGDRICQFKEFMIKYQL
jgi:hypothetical protein